MISISRRRFLALGAGLVVTGCADSTRPSAAPDTSPSPTVPPGILPTAPPATSPAVVTTVSTPEPAVGGDRVLVLVELNGGNDAVNTMPPLTGVYRDLRPTIALPEPEILLPAALDGHGLHPSLAPLVRLLDGGRLAMVAGIGFDDPNRSHFVSTDRWTRADRMDEELGWLGRWLDLLPDDPPALGATALGNAGAVLRGAGRRGTAIGQVDAFAFPPELRSASVRALTEPLSDEPLLAAAQRAFGASVGAVQEFDEIADAVRSGLPSGDSGQPSGAFSTGLAVAAQLVLGEVGARVVTVSVAGFDTHAEQLATHAELLADLASGLASFWTTLDAAGASHRAMVATTSEFGRRVAENASNGCDHGAAGLSLVMANSVAGAQFGSLDAGDLLDGDLRPQIDPRTMFTACLDWLDADVERILGRRYDQIRLLA